MPTGGMTPRTGRLILALTAAAFASSLAGLLYSLATRLWPPALLFAANMASMWMVKRLYSSTLCKNCDVANCPFNPARRRRG